MFKAKRHVRLNGKDYYKGDEIPEDILTPRQARTLAALGKIEGAGLAPSSSAQQPMDEAIQQLTTERDAAIQERDGARRELEETVKAANEEIQRLQDALREANAALEEMESGSAEPHTEQQTITELVTVQVGSHVIHLMSEDLQTVINTIKAPIEGSEGDEGIEERVARIQNLDTLTLLDYLDTRKMARQAYKKRAEELLAAVRNQGQQEEVESAGAGE